MTEIIPYESEQQVFEIISKHLFNQGVRSAKESDNHISCLYRGPNETSCAVGCLIPDSLYKEEFNNESVWGIAHGEHGDGLKKLFENIRTKFLADMQSVHDTLHNWNTSDHMQRELSHIGRRYGLDTKFLEDLSFNR